MTRLSHCLMRTGRGIGSRKRRRVQFIVRTRVVVHLHAKDGRIRNVLKSRYDGISHVHVQSVWWCQCRCLLRRLPLHALLRSVLPVLSLCLCSSGAFLLLGQPFVSALTARLTDAAFLTELTLCLTVSGACEDMYHRHPKRKFHLRKSIGPAISVSCAPTTTFLSMKHNTSLSLFSFRTSFECPNVPEGKEPFFPSPLPLPFRSMNSMIPFSRSLVDLIACTLLSLSLSGTHSLD